jgi:RNA polymerase sigma-70 factor, ECF subfamily
LILCDILRLGDLRIAPKTFIKAAEVGMVQHQTDSGCSGGGESVDCPLDVQLWYRRVFALCHSRLLSAADAEDATQETFVRALGCLHELRSPAAMGGWLRQIAHNVCVDTIRRQRVRQTSPVNLNEVAGVPLEAACGRESREQLVRLVHALPESLREIILLHYYESMTYDQMATWLNVARSTVNERLCKARQLLKKQLVMEDAS